MIEFPSFKGMHAYSYLCDKQEWLCAFTKIVINDRYTLIEHSLPDKAS